MATEEGDVALVATEVAAGQATQETERTESPVPRSLVQLERGSSVGRYLVVGVLGAGGMGVVYSAYDPELDRKVAIKLLQTNPTGGSSGDDSAWLLREAQALARLAHPNVVAIYDVGSLSEDRLFIAMELVEGETLRAWLARERRPWREVIPIMLAAGAGLAAAHKVKLVHRDFKPENVIVGSDGRVRVMDFGLARLRRDDEPAHRASDLAIDTKSPLHDLTIAGTFAGTPAYMAPEIHTGHAADARADQFAFGVALYEALFAALPFDRDALRAGDAAPPKLPNDSGVPARIQRVVARAIALDRDKRFESMDAVLHDLAIDPRAPRRRALTIGGAVLGAGAIVAATVMLSRSEPQICRGAEKRLGGVWDQTTKAAIRTAYAATKRKDAGEAYAALERALDSYTRDWTTASIESCEATRVRRDQTEEVLSLRQTCLDLRLEELRALTRLLATEPSPSVVEKGGNVVLELEPLAQCSDVEGLREPGKPPPGPRTKELEGLLASAKADMIAGRFLPLLVSTQKLIDGAGQIKYDGMEAEAHMLRAVAFLAAQNGEDSANEYAAAVRTAISARLENVAARCALQAAMVDAAMLNRPREGRVWLTIGVAYAKRFTDPMTELIRYDAEGVVAAQNGDIPGAVVAHTKMLEIAQRVYRSGTALLEAENKLATTLTRASKFKQAAATLEDVVKKTEAATGPNHPDLAIALSNLGLCHGKLGDLAKSRAALERSLAIRERLFGKTAPFLLVALDNLADILKSRGHAAEAMPIIERAMTIAKTLPREDVTYQTIATSYADIAAANGRAAEAHATYDAILPVEERLHTPSYGTTLAYRADLAIAEQRWDEAAGFAERAVTELEAAGGVANPDLWQPLGALGRAKLELGKLDDAKLALDRALALGAMTDLPGDDFAAIRQARARL